MFKLNNKPNDDQLKDFIKKLSECVKRECLAQTPKNNMDIFMPDLKPREIPLDEFIQQALIALNDVFCADIYFDGKNCLFLHFSENNVFKIHITRN